MSAGEVKIQQNGMPADMTRDALDYARLAYLTHTDKFQVAKYIRDEFNKKYKPYWVCVLGPPTYTACYQHDKDANIVFDMNNERIMLFKIS